VFRDDAMVTVVAFTATQIPGIARRQQRFRPPSDAASLAAGSGSAPAGLPVATHRASP
jgi:hypothetical protein